jgi:hypothetical protein
MCHLDCEEAILEHGQTFSAAAVHLAVATSCVDPCTSGTILSAHQASGLTREISKSGLASECKVGSA